MTQEQPEALIAEYRPSMPHEVLHDWANDAVAELRRLHSENEALRTELDRAKQSASLIRDALHSIPESQS